MITHGNNLQLAMKCVSLILLSLFVFYNASDVKAQGKQSLAGSYLKARINNVDWEAGKMVFDKYPSEIVQVWGDKGNTSLRLQLNRPTQGKTDKLIKTDLNSWTDENYNMYMTQEGTTQITKMDELWIEGTFQFSAKDNRSGKQIVVTSGSFRIPNPKRFKE